MFIEGGSPRLCRISVVIGATRHEQIVERALGGNVKALEHGGTPALFEAVKRSGQADRCGRSMVARYAAHGNAHEGPAVGLENDRRDRAVLHAEARCEGG